MMEYFLLLAIIGIPLFIVSQKVKVEDEHSQIEFEKQYHEQKNTERSVRTEQLIKSVEEHQDVLISHWYSGRKKDEYGQLDESKWIDEALRFLEMFNYGKLKRERVTDASSVSEIVERILEQRNTSHLIPSSTSCLLYTSPSPRDRTRSRMPSSA